MGKQPVFKKLATKITSGMKVASKVAKPAAYVAKYNKEIMAAGKFIKKNAGGGDPEKTMKIMKKVAKGAQTAGKYAYDNRSTLAAGAKSALKDPRVQKMILDKSVGLGLKYGEKYADKKLGKYKAYRIAKGGVNLLYNVGTGNVGGAIGEASNIYGEADPNKKRVAKVKAGVAGATKMVNSAMSGDYAGAYSGALSTYAAADPNKKRVSKVMNINNKYIAPAYDMYNAGKELYGQGGGAVDVATQSKLADLKVNVKSQKLNSAMSGSNIGMHKTNVMAAHDSQDYGALAKHAKLLHSEAKNANKIMKADPIGVGGKKPGYSSIVAGEPRQGRPNAPAYRAPSIPSPSQSAPVAPAAPIGGGGKKPRN